VQRQLSWENTVATPWGSLLLLADHLAQKVAKPADPYDVSQRTVQAVAAGLNGSANGHHWQANVRHDRNSQFGKQTTGSAAYGLEVASGLRASASWGRTFVAPSFNQLYYPFFGSPNLLPEEGTQREFSLRWQAAGFTSRLAYFDNRIRGYISSGPQPANIPTTRIDGISASTEGQWGAWLLAASLDSVNPVNSTAGSGNFGKRLPNRVQESARLAADWSGGPLKLGATLVGHGDRFADADNATRVAGFATLDVRADWQVARAWGLGLKLNNLGGQVYETVYGYNQPGREAFLTLRYNGL
jgi:vitamin B12 transporter